MADKDPLAEGETTGTDPLEEVVAAVEATDPLEESAEVVEEPKKAAAAAPDSNAALATAISKLTDSLAKPGVMSPEQQEAAWQQAEAASGLSRQQLIDQDRRTRQSVLAASLDTNKELGKLKVEKILGDEHSDLLAEVEKTMATLPLEIQANPKAWEDAAYLMVGRLKMGKKNETSQGQRRIVGGGSQGTTQGKAPERKAALKTYTTMEQALIARQFGGKSEEYEKYKVNKSVETDVRITAAAGSNNADKELERMTAQNT